MTKVLEPTLYDVLLDDVVAGPGDPTARLVLADHLTDLGDDDRAAFWRWAATPVPGGDVLLRSPYHVPLDIDNRFAGVVEGSQHRWLRPGYPVGHQGCVVVGACQLPCWLHQLLRDHTTAWGVKYSMHYPTPRAAWLEAQRVWCSLPPGHPGKRGLLPELEEPKRDGTYDG